MTVAVDLIAVVHVAGPVENAMRRHPSGRAGEIHGPFAEQRCLRCDDLLLEASPRGRSWYKLGQRVGLCEPVPGVRRERRYLVEDRELRSEETACVPTPYCFL